MKAIIVGIKEVKGTNKQGRPYAGSEVHFSYERSNVSGRAVDRKYISDNVMRNCDPFRPGDEVDIYFNQYGGVDVIKAV